jgi:hypothetical protein
VTIAIDADQAVLAQVYLRAMASAIEGVAYAARPEDQQEFWAAYAENEAKLHTIIPPTRAVAVEQRTNQG